MQRTKKRRTQYQCESRYNTSVKKPKCIESLIIISYTLKWNEASFKKKLTWYNSNFHPTWD